jgi:DNA polymerase-4
MRAIIHSDMNAFYASVEQAEHPELRGRPVIVGGDEQSRHGIVLTASYEAKAAGVTTASTLWQARAVCPEAIVVPPHYELYHRYGRLARHIYYDYTDLVEPFGPDEAWLDVTDSAHLFGGDATLVAREISERVRSELGLGVSVGVSWNKVFAKFGSDHDKPNGYLEVLPANAMDVVWPRPVSELIYVGPATTAKLAHIGVATIGDLACCDAALVRRCLGKVGGVLQGFARGADATPVRPLDLASCDVDRVVKSVGNGITVPFDVEDAACARQVVWLMGESVAQRVRALGLEARCVSVSARDAATLGHRSRQCRLARPSNVTSELCGAMARLMDEGWDVAATPVRALSVRASGLVPALTGPVQLDLWGSEEARLKAQALDASIDALRARFGNHAVRRGVELADERLARLDPEHDNITHPVSFFA